MIDRYLAPVIARFCAQHPSITLSLRTPFQPLDLMRHEADIAIRVCEKPPDPLVGRRLFDFALGVYATPDYVKSLPTSPDPSSLHWIGWESESYNHHMIMGNFPDAKISHRVDSLLVALALVREGMGVSVFPCYWADADSSLSRIYDEPVARNNLGRDNLGLWVLVHPDVRRLSRVRAFVDFLTPELLADRARFEGRNTRQRNC
jgi:DNA-binding transcriptional LysR family regulator